jgi:hypothetical protein
MSTRSGLGGLPLLTREAARGLQPGDVWPPVKGTCKAQHHERALHPRTAYCEDWGADDPVDNPPAWPDKPDDDMRLDHIALLLERIVEAVETPRPNPLTMAGAALRDRAEEAVAGTVEAILAIRGRVQARRELASEVIRASAVLDRRLVERATGRPA